MKEREKMHQPVRSGALTLLIAVVVLCLAVLAVLSLSTAKASEKMADKQLEDLALQTAAENAGQQWLAGVDAALAGGALPADAELLADGQITGDLQLDASAVLHLAVQPQTSGTSRCRIVRWQLERSWDSGEQLDLWKGN